MTWMLILLSAEESFMQRWLDFSIASKGEADSETTLPHWHINKNMDTHWKPLTRPEVSSWECLVSSTESGGWGGRSADDKPSPLLQESRPPIKHKGTQTIPLVDQKKKHLAAPYKQIHQESNTTYVHVVNYIQHVAKDLLPITVSISQSADSCLLQLINQVIYIYGAS